MGKEHSRQGEKQVRKAQEGTWARKSHPLGSARGLFVLSSPLGPGLQGGALSYHQVQLALPLVSARFPCWASQQMLSSHCLVVSKKQRERMGVTSPVLSPVPRVSALMISGTFEFLGPPMPFAREYIIPTGDRRSCKTVHSYRPRLTRAAGAPPGPHPTRALRRRQRQPCSPGRHTQAPETF